jgi:hypothetical protein
MCDKRMGRRCPFYAIVCVCRLPPTNDNKLLSWFDFVSCMGHHVEMEITVPISLLVSLLVFFLHPQMVKSIYV